MSRNGRSGSLKRGWRKRCVCLHSFSLKRFPILFPPSPLSSLPHCIFSSFLSFLILSSLNLLPCSTPPSTFHQVYSSSSFVAFFPLFLLLFLFILASRPPPPRHPPSSSLPSRLFALIY